MVPKGCLEKSVRIYNSSLRNNPGECSSHILRGGSLKLGASMLLVAVVTCLAASVTLDVNQVSPNLLTLPYKGLPDGCIPLCCSRPSR